MLKSSLAAAAAVALVSGAASASTFVNGDFETGTTAGWTTGTGYRAPVFNNVLNPLDFAPGGAYYNSSLNHSAIVSGGFAPNTDGHLRQVYSGNYSFRAEDVFNGGYASVITQSVTNYTDPNIFFAWAAVLEGAHGVNDAATFKLVLRDDTDNVDLITRQYNAASGGGGVDQRFTLSSNNYYYTDWQVEQLALGNRAGHNFTLTLLAADCEQTGHAGYVYLDGFGAVTPPTGNAPVPATLALLGLGMLGMGAARRRQA